jgi:hypothetical protein
MVALRPYRRVSQPATKEENRPARKREEVKAWSFWSS